jgi:hypothetical protein
MGLETDLPPGEALAACFRPFIEHLANAGLSSKTVRRHQDGGPLVHNGSEEQQRSFDATCRKLHRFLDQPRR